MARAGAANRKGLSNAQCAQKPGDRTRRSSPSTHQTLSALPGILEVVTQTSSRPKIAMRCETPSGVLGIDYGRARIGLALADAQAALPRPLDTLQRVNRNEDMRRLREIVREHEVGQIVVGLPLRLDGTARRNGRRSRALR